MSRTHVLTVPTVPTTIPPIHVNVLLVGLEKTATWVSQSWLYEKQTWIFRSTLNVKFKPHVKGERGGIVFVKNDLGHSPVCLSNIEC